MDSLPEDERRRAEDEALPTRNGKMLRRTRPGRARLRAVLILLLALAATLSVWLNAREELKQRAQSRFQARAATAVEEFRAHLAGYEAVLHGAAGLLRADHEISFTEWREYVQTLDLPEHFPGILGVGFAPYIAREDLPRFIARSPQLGLKNFAIHPAGTRDHYGPVLFLAPWNWHNRRAVGDDLYADPTRRMAMERARDSGDTTLSGPVTHTPDDAHQADILMFKPVYAGGMVPDTVERRRRRLRGFVYSPYRMPQLITSILGHRLYDGSEPALDLQVFDGGSVQGPLLFDTGWRHNTFAGAHPSAYSSIVQIDAAGRAWTLRFLSLPPFEQGLAQEGPRLVLATGLAISLLLFAISWSLATLREHAVRLAQRMTRELEEERTQLREITATLGEGLYVLDVNGRIGFVNPAAEHLLNSVKEQLLGQLGRRFLDLPTPETGQRNGEAELNRQGGETIPVTYVITPIRRAGNLSGAVVAFNDIRARKQAEAALRESEQFQKLFLYSGDALFLLDLDGHIIDANRLACESLGHPREELVGGALERFTRRSTAPRPGQDLKSFFEEVHHKLVLGEAEFEHRSGRRFQVELTYSAIFHEGRNLLLVSARDVTARKEAERRMNEALAELERSQRQVEEINRKLTESNRELDRLSRRDGLTGIANRRHFDEYLQREWNRAERDGQPLSLLLIDVDHFKAFNDHYGHQAGDDCLRRIAETLDGELARSIDMVARYGGEEFVVVLPETPPGGALNLAERMRAGVFNRRMPHAHSPVAPFVTISVGVTTSVPCHPQTPEALLAAADKALYIAKEQGRNRVISAPTFSES